MTVHALREFARHRAAIVQREARAFLTLDRPYDTRHEARPDSLSWSDIGKFIAIVILIGIAAGLTS